MRLYHRESDYQGTWWGIRPDTTGPYFDPREWEESSRIGSVLKSAVLDGDARTVTFLRGELARRRIRIKDLASNLAEGVPKSEEEIRVVIARADPKNADQIGNLPFEAARAACRSQAMGDAERGKRVFTAQSCRACHTDADGQTPKGPHLVDIGNTLQSRGTRGVDPEAQRQDCSGVRVVQLRDNRRTRRGRLHCRRGGDGRAGPRVFG